MKKTESKNQANKEQFYYLMHKDTTLQAFSSERQPCKPGETFSIQSGTWNPTKKLYKVTKIEQCIGGGFDVICEFVKEIPFFNKN